MLSLIAVGFVLICCWYFQVVVAIIISFILEAFVFRIQNKKLTQDANSKCGGYSVPNWCLVLQCIVWLLWFKNMPLPSCLSVHQMLTAYQNAGTVNSKLVTKLEAIQRWPAICRMWPWTLTYQKFLLCVSSQVQDLYSHQKLNMYIYWFSSESGYRRRWRRRQCRTPRYNQC